MKTFKEKPEAAITVLIFYSILSTIVAVRFKYQLNKNEEALIRCKTKMSMYMDEFYNE